VHRRACCLESWRQRICLSSPHLEDPLFRGIENSSPFRSLIGDSSIGPTASFFMSRPAVHVQDPVDTSRPACRRAAAAMHDRPAGSDGSRRQPSPRLLGIRVILIPDGSGARLFPKLEILECYVGNCCTVSRRISHTCEAQQLEHLSAARRAVWSCTYIS
jgi:hypothetical protein